MITIHPAEQRGHTQSDWLDSYHTFSFSDFYDPNRMSFCSLRVINEDRILPTKGFGTHAHRDVEIITYVLSGSLEHKDSLGNGSMIIPGKIQKMSAGTGILHSEWNPSKSDPVHLLQIWIVPDKKGLKPSYEEHSFDRGALQGKWQLLASGSKNQKVIHIHQDTDLNATTLETGQMIDYAFKPGRCGWLQVAGGDITVNEMHLKAGDGAQINHEKAVSLKGISGPAELVLFDLGIG
ncbi:MAG: pirin family protein [Candidatus Omnitrophica bacterium]|nr:pirin family protein [Candidatus Omnitrophota bacterium]